MHYSEQIQEAVKCSSSAGRYSVDIIIRPRYLSGYIHENRHVNQIFAGTSGLTTNSDWYDEIQAYEYQEIYSPGDVSALIMETARGKYGPEWQSGHWNFSITDMVKIRYANTDHIHSTTDLK